MFEEFAFHVLRAVIGLVLLSPGLLLIIVAERLWGRFRKNLFGKAARTDYCFLLLGTFYGGILHFFGTLIGAVFAVEFLGLGETPFFIGELSITVQLLAVLILRDLFIYVRHRLFHSRSLWPFHAVHHSSEQVNWLSTARFHPIEALIEVALDILLFALLGAHADVAIVASLVIGFNNFLIHSDLPWSYGPFRFILVSPLLHRWHHSKEKSAANKNFAAMFSFLDLILGTFYMPRDRYPEKVGIPKIFGVVPEEFVSQLAYPFREYFLKHKD